MGINSAKPTLKSNIILLLISIFLTIFAIEIVNYFIVANSNQYYVWQPNLNTTFLPNSEVMSGISGPSHFTINEMGYRGPSIKDKSKEYRILILGGSTSESLYLDNTETWPYLLMEKLNYTSDGRKIITMNIGKSGFNLRDNFLELKHLSSFYKPDLIISMVGVNDMLLKLSKRWVWKPFDESKYDLTRVFYSAPKYTVHSSMTFRLFKFFYSKFYLKEVPQDEVGETIIKSRLERKNSANIIKEMPDLSSPLQDYESNLNKIIDLSLSNNITLLFSTQPFIWKDNMSVEEDASLWMATDFNGNFYPIPTMIKSMDLFNNKLLDVCFNNPEITCIDLEKQVPKNLDFFYDDIHFNENGSYFVAEKLSIFIKQNLKEFQVP